ncbi:MAG: LemA family protein [Pseudomonadota bacterium]
MEYLFFGALAVLVIFGFVFYVLYANYNRVMALDERCNTAYADIDVLLKHRHTLLPGLMNLVKGSIDFEKETFDRLMEMREKAIQALSPKIRLNAEEKLGENIASIVNAAEANPQLRASEHFQKFRQELVDVENRITASRRFYNVTVEEFNATVRQFPANLIASKARIGRREHYSLGTEKLLMDEPVSVKF